MKRASLLLAFTAMLLTLVASASAQETKLAQAASSTTESLSTVLKKYMPKDLPMLDDLVVIKPSLEVPPQLAELSGAWVGEWRGDKTSVYMGDQVYVFEEVSATSLTLVTAGIGRYQAPRGQRGSNAGRTWSDRFKGVQPEGTSPFTVTLPNGNKNTYQVRDGQLNVQLITPGGIVWNGTFKKIQ